MDYIKNYNDLMESCKNKNRKRGDGNYYERHHIKPKSIFPELSKDPNNLVLLTAREHYIAHLLLTKIYSEGENHRKMVCALYFMINGNKKHFKHFHDKVKSSKEYERIRREYGEVARQRNTGTKRTAEQKQNMKEQRRQYIEEHSEYKETLKNNSRKSLAKARESKKKRTQDRLETISNLGLDNMTPQQLHNIKETYPFITETDIRVVKVNCKCPTCKKIYQVSLRAFTREDHTRQDFVCFSCVHSKIMKEHNPGKH